MSKLGLDDILNCEECDAIDYNEFNIPAILETQTLETILNEEPIYFDDGLIDIIDTASVSSGDSLISNTRSRVSSSYHGVLLHHGLLKAANSHLAAAKERVDAGTPTCVTVTSLFAVGTSHGLVFVFDSSQILKHCFGSSAVGEKYGAVSCLSFNHEDTRLLAGFAKGTLLMWDLSTGKLLRTICDAHPPGNAVLSVQFIESSVAVCCDSGGSLFQLEFKRSLGGRACETLCLFSGSRGEICCVEPFRISSRQPLPTWLQDLGLLAMASFTKLFVVSLRPSLKVQYTTSLVGDASCLPLLAWQMQTHEVQGLLPVLLYARESSVHILQVDSQLKFSPLHQFDVSYKLLSAQWMNLKTLALIDNTELLHLVDVDTVKEIESDPLHAIQLCYNTSLFKSLATGGNVSKALEHASQQACYNSLQCFDGQLVILGVRDLHVYRLRAWQERLSVLTRRNHWLEALAEALAYLEGRAFAVVGLPKEEKARRARVLPHLSDLLREFTSNALSCSDLFTLEKSARSCLDVCISAGLTDLLFHDLYKEFSKQSESHTAFLEALVLHILKEKLSVLPTEVIKAMVKYLKRHNRLQEVERCLLHLDIAALDLNSVVKICHKYDLYTAYLRVYCEGLKDYLTPLEYFTRILNEAVHSGEQLSTKNVQLGNLLLLFLNGCLAGAAYPRGRLDEPLCSQIQQETLRFLCADPPFSNLITLLKFDARSFLNSLAVVWTEPFFLGADGLQRKNQLVWRLHQCMIVMPGFNSAQIATLSVFLAHQLSRQENNGLQVKADLFEQVLEFLFNGEEAGREDNVEERQNAVLELLNSGNMTKELSLDRILVMAERASFHQVCQHIYRERGDLCMVFECILRDQQHANGVFSFIRSSLRNQSFSDDVREKLKKEAIGQLDRLVEVDAMQTVQLMLLYLAQKIEAMVGRLRSQPNVLFLLLRAFFDLRRAERNTPLLGSELQVNPQVAEQYVELLCNQEKLDDQEELLMNFLRHNKDYRPAAALKLVKQHDHLQEAAAFLLERKEDFEGALLVLLKRFHQDWSCLTKQATEQNKPASHKDLAAPWLENVHDALTQCCALNHRATRHLSAVDNVSEAAIRERKQALWFLLLEQILDVQVAEPKETALLKELSQKVVWSMTQGGGSVSLSAVMERLLRHPAYRKEQFRHMQSLLVDMLAVGRYERTLLETCGRLARRDLLQQMQQFQRTAHRGFVPKQRVCRSCLGNFTAQSCSMTLFRCGHSFHEKCVRAVRSSVHNKVTFLCPLCNNVSDKIVNQNQHEELLSSEAEDESKLENVIDDVICRRFQRVRESTQALDYVELLTRWKTGAPSGAQKNNVFLAKEQNVLNLAPKTLPFMCD